MKRIILIKSFSIWDAGTVFTESGGMWKQFVGAIHGISLSDMRELTLSKKAQYID